MAPSASCSTRATPPLPARLHSVGMAPVWVALSDLDGDGLPDLVVANLTGGTISVLYNLGSGSFATQVTLAAASPVAVAVADFDGDGRPDIAVSNYYSTSTVGVLFNTGNRSFAG